MLPIQSDTDRHTDQDTETLDYLLKVGEIYHYNRRVPSPIRPYDGRRFVRISLRTDSRQEARKLALIQNGRLEEYWRTLVQSGETHSEKTYSSLLHQARLLGYSYLPCKEAAQLPLQQVVDRLQHVEKHDYAPKHVEAVLGAQERPQVTIDEIVPKYFHHSKDRLLNKTAQQVRKWKNPRKKAIQNFRACLGSNKPIQELVRNDFMNFRDWWIDRLNAEDLVSATANKDFKHIRHMIRTVAKNADIKLDYDHLFSDLILSENDSRKRASFTTEYLRETLLNPEKLKGLNNKAQAALYAFSETGAGISELAGVLPEDIYLHTPIPYIRIVPRKKKALKTVFRERDIPLVGYALDAFKAFPQGFSEYIDDPDRLSQNIGKYLRENNLYPSERHSLYSLRHSFQNRLRRDARADDKQQTDLMGHRFNREDYGDDTTLEDKFEIMKKIQLKPQTLEKKLIQL